MYPLTKSKWDLKIHPAMSSYHTRSRRNPLTRSNWHE